MPQTAIKPSERRCWHIADAAIAHYWLELKAARERGDTRWEGVCLEMIDDWLEYRKEHRRSDTDVI